MKKYISPQLTNEYLTKYDVMAASDGISSENDSSSQSPLNNQNHRDNPVRFSMLN